MPYKEEDKRVLSVGDFVKLINALISRLEPVWVEGEIIGFKNWKDRVVFFDIKDEEAILHCSIYYSRLQSLGLELEDGMKVKVIGEPQLRANRGSFNLNVRDIQLSGEGAFKKAYELLKKKLKTEGLFERKREIPSFVENIGVITSKDGAVIHDFRKNLRDVNYKIYFKDALVEGKKSAKSLTKAVKWFNKNMPNLDVLVIMRGGGSLESLQGFNNEVLVRTIYGSEIPTLCGIGHEVDIPLASLVADVSVSTPTAAASYLNQSWDSLEENIPYWQERIFNSFKSILDSRFIRLSELGQRISFGFSQTFNKFESLTKDIYNIFDILRRQKELVGEKIKTIEKKLILSLENDIEKIKKIIVNQERYLKALDPRRNLKLGYSIVFDEDGKIIKEIGDVKKGETIKTKLHKGSILSKINKINKNNE